MKFLNRKSTKIISCALVIALMCGIGSAVSYAMGTKDSERAAAANTEGKTSSVKSGSSYTGDSSKDETVYVLANSDGSVKKVIVSDWIKNPDGEDAITDASSLEDVEVVKGDATYTMNEENMKVWDTQGEDVYYQGTTEKSLPVDVTISYKLDGKNVSAEELAGKSGKVTIRFDYTNNEKQTVEIDGKNETIYVPFLMLTGTMLNNDKFSNVEVTNGKVVNDGDKTIVVGFALPGMQENLNIDKKDMEFPEYVEIVADVTDFELDTTLTYASNDIFNEVDTEKADDVTGDISKDMDALQTNMDALVSGSSQLYGYLGQLLNKSGELISGVNTLVNGAQELADGTSEIADGAVTLQAYLTELSDGLEEITSYNSQLNGGAEEVFNTLLSTATQQLTAAGITVPQLTIENYDTVLDNVLASLDEDAIRANAESQARANTATIRASIESQYYDVILESVLSASGLNMNAGEYEAAVSAGNISAAVQTQIDAAVETQLDAQTESYIQGIIQQAVNDAAAGRDSVTALKAQLDKYNEFYQGVLGYTANVSDAYDGSAEILEEMEPLISGSGDAASGTQELLDGLKTLSGKSGTLVSAVSELTDGAMTLNEGLQQYNEQGIQKIIGLYDNVDQLAVRLKAVSDASKNYDTFGGKSDGMSGNVKFIYTTDSIAVEK